MLGGLTGKMGAGICLFCFTESFTGKMTLGSLGLGTTQEKKVDRGFWKTKILAGNGFYMFHTLPAFIPHCLPKFTLDALRAVEQ